MQPPPTERFWEMLKGSPVAWLISAAICSHIGILGLAFRLDSPALSLRQSGVDLQTKVGQHQFPLSGVGDFVDFPDIDGHTGSGFEGIGLSVDADGS